MSYDDLYTIHYSYGKYIGGGNLQAYKTYVSPYPAFIGIDRFPDVRCRLKPTPGQFLQSRAPLGYKMSLIDEWEKKEIK